MDNHVHIQNLCLFFMVWTRLLGSSGGKSWCYSIKWYFRQQYDHILWVWGECFPVSTWRRHLAQTKKKWFSSFVWKSVQSCTESGPQLHLTPLRWTEKPTASQTFTRHHRPTSLMLLWLIGGQIPAASFQNQGLRTLVVCHPSSLSPFNSCHLSTVPIIKRKKSVLK